MIGTAVDITERKDTEAARESLLHEEQAARARAEAARERLSFLIRAGREIRAVLDPDIVMRTAAELVVPDLGDWALVIEPDGVTIRAWAGAEFATTAWSLGGATGHRLHEPADMFRQVVATGEPHLFAVPGPLTLCSDEEPPVTVELTAASIAAVPLQISGQTMGILTVGHRRSARPYDSGDLALLQQYAEAVAAAIDKALLFEERSAIARVLQQSLLPASLPTVEGVEIETEYQPVGDGLIVGGDFYDVFRISDGRYAFAVGDVSGKGSEAAAVTALVRHSIRAFAETHDDPADVLVAVNDAIRIHGPSLRYCTAVYGVLTLTGSGPGSRVDVTVAVGGHPLPILLRNDGAVEYIGQPGTLLGMFPDVGVKAMAQSLDPGDALILYTDGGLDSRRAGVPFGEERLRSVLEEAVGQSAASIAGRFGAAVAEYHDEPSDDVAVLVLRRSP
jgi:serine phosphatase RsbU (regulator of sigma subunit)